MLLGDRIESALERLGLAAKAGTIEEWLGHACYCAERKEKLNQLDRWARRVLTGKVAWARRHLRSILERDDHELPD